MNKKEVIAFILLIIGIFLIGSTPTPTGAVIGTVITTNFLGFILFLASLILLVAEEGLETKIEGKPKSKIERELNLAQALLERRQIPTKYRELCSIAIKMGYKPKEGSDHVDIYRNGERITEIPRHKGHDLNKNTARGILRALSAAYSRYH